MEGLDASGGLVVLFAVAIANVFLIVTLFALLKRRQAHILS